MGHPTMQENDTAKLTPTYVPSKFTSLFFVQFNSTHLPKFSPLLSLTLFGVQSLSADC